MSIFDRFRNALKALRSSPSAHAATLDALLQLELARELAHLQAETLRATPDNPAARGFKVYSQTDEDGIIEDICCRLSLERGFFLEIGCGDGRENNTHYLLLKGWRGIWVDGDPANIASIHSILPQADRLRVIEKMVTCENVVSIIGESAALDLLSVDVDGNDLAVACTAVEAWKPKVVVCEYNAKFRYPVKAEVEYDPTHRWQCDDYHGASLAACVDALKSQYRLVCCNLAGTNAFFVRHDVASRFETYEPAHLYQPARFYLTAIRSGHSPSLSFLLNALVNPRQPAPSSHR